MIRNRKATRVFNDVINRQTYYYQVGTKSGKSTYCVIINDKQEYIKGEFFIK